MISLVAHGVLHQGFAHIGGDIAWRDGVHVNALGGPLVGERAGQAHNGSLRRSVGRYAVAAEVAEHGRHVDDLALVLRDHLARGELAQEEHGVEIDVDHIVPRLLFKVHGRHAPLDASAVDENVQMGAEKLHALGKGTPELLALAQIGDHAVDGVALFPKIVAHREHPLGAVDEHDLRSGLAEAFGEIAADALHRADAGHDGFFRQGQTLPAFPLSFVRAFLRYSSCPCCICRTRSSGRSATSAHR